MKQAKFSLSSSQLKFLEQAQAYGFKDKSQAVRVALDRLMRDLRDRRLRESARIYTETLAEDAETVEWLDEAVDGWPE